MKIITSVAGDLPLNAFGITDAHNHIWIDPIPGTNVDSPVLNKYKKIALELKEFEQAGGTAIIDCQPAGCGRNGTMLAKLAKTCGVIVVSATGFHRPLYYTPDYWLWSENSDRIADFFIQEIEKGELETMESEYPVRAGFIKIACEETLEKTFQPALYAVVQAARQSGKAIEIHTEKGQSAMEILTFFCNQGVDTGKIVLCHMDKRPDFGLHRELVQSGAALEYDTFFRSKYQPEINLWPLIQKMAEAGYWNSLCLATDFAEEIYWNNLQNGPGLRAFPEQIRQHLLDLGLAAPIVSNLIGGNICRILATEVENKEEISHG